MNQKKACAKGCGFKKNKKSDYHKKAFEIYATALSS